MESVQYRLFWKKFIYIVTQAQKLKRIKNSKIINICINISILKITNIEEDIIFAFLAKNYKGTIFGI